MRDVMMAFPHPGTVRTEFMLRTMTAVQEDASRIAEVAELSTGPGIGVARNKIAERFLTSTFDWLWMVDTDMVFSEATLPRLLEAADPELRPVIGAMCCVISDSQVKTTIYEASRDDEGDFAFRHLTEWPDNTVLRVDATGAGCLLVHRSVFKRISEANPEADHVWFAEMVIGPHQIGEDLSFCMRCAMAEIPVFVHTGVEVGHMKTLQLGNVRP